MSSPAACKFSLLLFAIFSSSDWMVPIGHCLSFHALLQCLSLHALPYLMRRRLYGFAWNCRCPWHMWKIILYPRGLESPCLDRFAAFSRSSRQGRGPPTITCPLSRIRGMLIGLPLSLLFRRFDLCACMSDDVFSHSNYIWLLWQGQILLDHCRKSSWDGNLTGRQYYR